MFYFYTIGGWPQYRFKNFYLDVSNSPAVDTDTSQRTRCHTDTSNPYPSNEIELQCKQTARYVIVETTYDTPEDGATRGAILEICEIQVYGLYQNIESQFCICTIFLNCHAFNFVFILVGIIVVCNFSVVHGLVGSF
jgi:hypothetical protein